MNRILTMFVGVVCVVAALPAAEAVKPQAAVPPVVVKPADAPIRAPDRNVHLLKLKQRFNAGAMGVLRIQLPSRYTLDRDYPVYFCIDSRATYPPSLILNPPAGGLYVSVSIPCPLPNAGPSDLMLLADAVLEVLDREVPNTTSLGALAAGSNFGANALINMAQIAPRFAERFQGFLLIDGGDGQTTWLRQKKVFVAGFSEVEGILSPAQVFCVAAQKNGVDVTWFAKAPPKKGSVDPDREAMAAAAKVWMETKVLAPARAEQVAAAARFASDGKWLRCLKAWRVAKAMVPAAESGPLDQLLPGIEAGCAQAAGLLPIQVQAAQLRDYLGEWRGCAALKGIRERAEALAQDDVERALALPNQPNRISHLQRLHAEWRGFAITLRTAELLEPTAQQELDAAKAKVSPDQRVKSYRYIWESFAMTPSGAAAKVLAEEAASAELAAILEVQDGGAQLTKLLAFCEKNSWLPCAPKAFGALAKLCEEQAREMLIQTQKLGPSARKRHLLELCERYPGTSSEVLARSELARR